MWREEFARAVQDVLDADLHVGAHRLARDFDAVGQRARGPVGPARAAAEKKMAVSWRAHAGENEHPAIGMYNVCCEIGVPPQRHGLLRDVLVERWRQVIHAVLITPREGVGQIARFDVILR